MEDTMKNYQKKKQAPRALRASDFTDFSTRRSLSSLRFFRSQFTRNRYIIYDGDLREILTFKFIRSIRIQLRKYLQSQFRGAFIINFISNPASGGGIEIRSKLVVVASRQVSSSLDRILRNKLKNYDSFSGNQ